MNRIIFTTLLLLLADILCAQPNYSSLSPEEAARKAGKENKLVMMVVNAEKCTQCNQVANMGLAAARPAIDSTCILIQQPHLPATIIADNPFFIIPKEFFGVVFLNPSLDILYVMNSSSSFGYNYISAIHNAQAAARSQSASFSELKHQYYNKLGDFMVIRQLIDKVISAKLEPTVEIINELTRKAPTDSAGSVSFLQYVLKTAPGVGSFAQQYAEKNRDNYMMAWWRMTLTERTTINQRIAYKSMQKAIDEKNLNYAYQVAGFRQRTYTDKPEDGAKANMQLMLQYYKGIGDTANYMRNVFSFYDNFYMNVKPEDIRKQDAESLKSPRLPDSVQQKIMTDAIKKKPMYVPRLVSYAPKAQFYAAALNEGAWTVYSYSKNPLYINKALLMARRALEFYETAETMDTYARLLYRNGNKEEAISWEDKAIALKKSRMLPATEFEQVVRLMREGAAAID
ncbi:MAG: hypothetical protein PHD73_08450 [Sediminibacterium sp.]|nr:hypothetical protein [Sediminibacterium sp.]